MPNRHLDDLHSGTGTRGDRLKLVILDRDGTINVDRADFVKAAHEWVPLSGALEAISRLNHAGWHTVIATNQSGLARGVFDMAALNAVHLEMNQALARVGGRIDAVFFCPHGQSQGCRCRKPSPGLFELIAERYGVHLKDVPVVGDSLRDLQAGVAAGCAPHLVRTGKAAALDDHEIAAIVRAGPATLGNTDPAAFAAQLRAAARAARGDSSDGGDTESLFGGLS
jgi:D-glycero-D-manno-heptose 1,7-bisphosphate phosphatase